MLLIVAVQLFTQFSIAYAKIDGNTKHPIREMAVQVEQLGNGELGDTITLL